MNTVFEKNMTALEQRYPDLAKRIKDTKDDARFSIISSKTGKPNVLIKNGSNLVMIHDNDDPEGEAKNYLNRLRMNYAPVIAFMGLGLGYHLDYFFKDMSKEAGTRHIIIFEKEIALFRLLLKMGDFSQVICHPNLYLFIGENAQDVFIKLTKIFATPDVNIALKSLKIVPLSAYIILWKDYFRDVTMAIKRAIRQKMVLTGNDSLDSFVGLENMLLNLKHVFNNPGVNALFGRFIKKPGILVAAGPSLDKNMYVLKELVNKALIVSCDASLIPLMKAGIRPHIVGTHERTPGTHLFYRGIDDFENIYLVAPPLIMPKSIDHFKGKKFIYSRGFSHFSWLEEEKGDLYTGMSVANMVFRLLESLGCDPIILIGQDLSYKDDGQTHAKGNIVGSRHENILQDEVIEIEGNNGRLVQTCKTFELHRGVMESDIANFSGTCINATEGGAKIHGTKVLTLEDTAEQFCTEEFYPHLILDEIHSKYNRDIDMKGKIERIQHKSRVCQEKMDALIGEMQKCLSMIKGVDEEIILPFIENTSLEPDMYRLKETEEKYLYFSEKISNDIDIWQLLAHTLNAYDTCFSNEHGFLRDIYTDEKCLAIARTRRIKEWFSVVGQFLVLTRNVLRKTENSLIEEIA